MDHHLSQICIHPSQPVYYRTGLKRKNIKTGLQLSSMFGTRRNVEYSTTKRYSGSPSRAGVVNEARAQIFLTNKINFLQWSGLEGKEGHHHSKGKEFLMSWDEKVVTSWRLFVLGGQRLICSRFWSDHFIEPLRSWWWSLYWEDREGHWVGPSRGFQSSRFMHSIHAVEIRGRKSTLERTKNTPTEFHVWAVFKILKLQA